MQDLFLGFLAFILLFYIFYLKSRLRKLKIYLCVMLQTSFIWLAVNLYVSYSFFVNCFASLDSLSFFSLSRN